MKQLSVRILEGVEQWKKTGLLPNGEKWSPYAETNLNQTVGGTPVAEFNTVVGSRLNLPRHVCTEILKILEESGYIKVVWHSPKGARYFLKRNRYET